jgi:phospholipid N-methyltransferase
LLPLFKDNPDFYPTPENLIRKMTSYIDIRTIRTILEPSAGTGNIVEYLIKQYKNNSSYYSKSYKPDIDCIEQQSELISVLKGKNFRVVQDNFLDYNSFKKYDLIIMNPPFSQGDKHLLKAIQLQERGGKIICLLNAETLKNSYSNIRKELIRQLEKYDAKVEYINNGFVNAERKTNVETALVYLDIPRVEYNSVIIDELKKEELHTTKQYNNTQLIDSDFIRGIVSQYEYEVKAGLRLIDEYQALRPLMLREFNKDTPVLKLELEYKDDSSTLENAYIKQIRMKYWKALFNNDQFMSLFTSNLKSKYHEMVNELQDYDFSFYNIYTLRIQLSKEMVQGVEDTILDLFEELSNKYHYYDETSRNVHLWNGWKSNSAYKINKRVVIPLNGFYDMQYSWGRYEPSHYRCYDKLRDIERTFSYLDNGITDEIDLKEVLKHAEETGKTKKIETRYFFIDFYKKGTTHLTFKNMDLLHKFNLVAAKSKMWLPPSYGKVKYSDMSSEEKQVIDEFEGKESYNKVMNNKAYFLVKIEELLRLTS